MRKTIPIAAAAVLTASQVAAQSEANCQPAPTPVLSLSFDSRYEGSGDARDQIDDEARKAAEQALKPLDGFLRDLASGLSGLLKADENARRSKADCLIGQLAEWALADALADQGSETTRLTMGSRFAGMAVVASEAARYTTDYAGLALVRDWLDRRMQEQMKFWEVAPKGAASGNLRAWAALAAAATADLNNDAVMRGWAAWSTAYVLCTAAEDGSLPQEMKRGKYALHYQLYALGPLVTSVVSLERQGVPMLGYCNDALDRAVAFALADLKDGSRTKAHAGVEQSFFDGTDTLEDFHLAWLEAYLLLNPDPMLENMADERRPLSFSKLGGNQTLLWGQ